MREVRDTEWGEGSGPQSEGGKGPGWGEGSRPSMKEVRDPEWGADPG